MVMREESFVRPSVTITIGIRQSHGPGLSGQHQVESIWVVMSRFTANDTAAGGRFHGESNPSPARFAKPET